jgi:hypothetical protein
VIQLSVDQHHYEAKRIDDIVRVQESADLFNAYTQSMGYALAKKVENYLAASINSNCYQATDVLLLMTILQLHLNKKWIRETS